MCVFVREREKERRVHAHLSTKHKKCTHMHVIRCVPVWKSLNPFITCKSSQKHYINTKRTLTFNITLEKYLDSVLMTRADGWYHVLRMGTLQFSAFGTLPCKFKMGQSAMLGLSDLIKGCKISKLGRSFPEKIGSYFLRNSSISKDIFELEIDLSGFCLNMRWEKFYINEVP